MNKLTNEEIDKISNNLFLKHFKVYKEAAENIEVESEGKTNEQILARVAADLSVLSVQFAKDFSTELAKEIIQRIDSDE